MKRPLLLPLVPLYYAASRLHRFAATHVFAQQSLTWPVVSVGSISAGGAGKTPFVLALLNLLEDSGLRPDVLSRGYGRASHTAIRVAPDGTAAEFGDEPLEIARASSVPVFVAASRFDAGLLAEQDWHLHGIHVLDDGFQHHKLRRDVDIVLISMADVRDTLLPAGNRRESLAALHHATVFAVPEDDTEISAWLRKRNLHQPIVRIRRRMVVPEAPGCVVAFCGIARPEQFFAGLEKTHDIGEQFAFADHAPYTEERIAALIRAARHEYAVAFVTTAKDAARLGPWREQLEAVAPVHVAELRAEILDAEKLLLALPNLSA